MHLSHLTRQILGALLGMAFAALVYVSINNLSTAGMRGYLVNTGENISENAGVVSTNSKTADAETLRRITSRAATVAGQLAAANTDSTATTAVSATEQSTADHSGAPVYQPNVQVIEVPTPTPPQTIIKEVKVPVPSEPKIVIKEVMVPTEPKIIIKEVQVPAPQQTIVREVRVPAPAPPPRIITREVIDQPYGKNLPDSGPALTVALLLSALGALAIIRPDLKHRFIALVTQRS